MKGDPEPGQIWVPAANGKRLQPRLVLAIAGDWVRYARVTSVGYGVPGKVWMPYWRQWASRKQAKADPARAVPIVNGLPAWR